MKIGNLDGIQDLRHVLPHVGAYAPRTLSDLSPDGPLRYLVIHHTASDPSTTPLQAALYHVHKLGWPAIGYHLWVAQDGAISCVGDLLTIRYNVAGRNRDVIGICLAGDFNLDVPTNPQIDAAGVLCANLQYALGWYVPIRGHRQIALPSSPTACPGDTYPSWLPFIKSP